MACSFCYARQWCAVIFHVLVLYEVMYLGTPLAVMSNRSEYFQKKWKRERQTAAWYNFNMCCQKATQPVDNKT